jgi:aldehyde dehydrogenase (NAD+)
LFDVPASTAADVEAASQAAHAAYLTWRSVRAHVRGGLVKRLGEVQETIDICDFAVPVPRARGSHHAFRAARNRLMETWHPLGVVGGSSAFNFPVAVWSWNAALALVCGDTLAQGVGFA